jgi:hypothetical protein
MTDEEFEAIQAAEIEAERGYERWLDEQAFMAAWAEETATGSWGSQFYD